MARNTTTTTTAAKGRKKRRRRLGRAILVCFALLLVLLVGLVVALPTIAGAVAPGIVQDSLNPRLNGRIEVRNVSVRWLRAGSPVQTASAEVFDDNGTSIAQVTLKSQFGLLDFLGGIGDVGEVVVSGRADVVRHADGTTNLERVFAPLMQGQPTPPDPTQTGEPPRLPPNLAAVLRIDTITGTFLDESRDPPLRVALESLTGHVDIATGKPAEATLEMAVRTGAPSRSAGATNEPRSRGTLSLAATIDSFSNAQGDLTIDQATADVTIAARDLPLGLADSIAGLDGLLTRAVGDTLRIDITAQGGLKQGAATLAIATDGGTSLQGAVNLADNVLTTTQPLTFTLDTARAAAADPAIAQALSAGEAARITTLPTLGLTLTDLRLRIPAGGAAPDLRGATATITAALGATAGTVAVPGQSQPQTFGIAPMNIVVATPDLAQGLNVSATTNATIGGRPAGALGINVRAADLLDEAGAPRTGLPAVAGAVVLDQFSMPIVQPILDAMAPDLGIALTDAIGPTLSFRLGAESASTGGTPLAPGAIPPTTLSLAVQSANVVASGGLRVATEAISTINEQGLSLRVNSLAPIARPFLEPAGVSLESGGQLTLRLQDLNFAEPTSDTPPLERASARLSVGLTETRGTLTMGASPTTYRVDPADIALNISGARDTIALTGQLNTAIQGDASIAARFDTTISGLMAQAMGQSRAVTSSGEGITITAAQVGRWLSSVLPPDAPVQLEPGGQLRLALSGIAIAAPPPTPAGNVGKAPVAPDIAQRLSVNLDVTGSDLRFAPVLAAALPGEAAPTPQMIRMGSLNLAARVAPSAAPSLTLESAYTVAGQPFTMGGSLSLQGPLSRLTTMREMVPRGRIALDQVPIEMLQLLPLDLKRADGQPINLTGMAREAVGNTLELVLNFYGGGQGAPADHSRVAFRLSGRGFRLETLGTINDQGLTASDTTLTTTVTPRLVQMATNNFAPDLPNKPRLTEHATINATLAGFSVPLDENLAPRPNSTVPLRATVETSMTVDNLVLAQDASERPINAGPITIRGLRAVANTALTLAAPAPANPAAGAATPGASPPMHAEFSATAHRPGRQNQPLLAITGTTSMESGVIDARATLSDLDLAWLDASLAQPGMISGALGPTATADVTFAGDPAANATATLALRAANLTMPQPARVSLTPSAITLASPIRATFTATADWATRYIFGQSDPANRMLVAAGSIPFNLNVASLTITRGQVGEIVRGPLVPGEFGVDATITAPEIAVRLQDGSAIRYQNPEVIVRTARNDPRRINGSIRMTDATAIAAAPTTTPTPGQTGMNPVAPGSPNAATPASGTPAAPANQPDQNIIRFAVMNAMNDAGQVDLTNATAEAIGRVPGFPTTIIDSLARQNGLLAELLGPTVALDLTARNVPLAFAAPTPDSTPPAASGNRPNQQNRPANTAPATTQPSPLTNVRGSVEATLTSPRARARLAGNINNLVLTTSEPLQISLSEITRALSEQLVHGMPLVSTFEKSPSLRPATVRGEGLTLPMDGNLANLNGRFTIDPGEITFSSSNLLGSLLKTAGGQASGVAGRRIQPFTFAIASGVVNYDRFSLPLGEFTISTTGSVNLVDQRMDLLVYLPVGAVADDALGLFNTGLGTRLSQLAPGFDGSLPFRIRGPIGQARPEPALDVFVKEFGSQLVNPGNLIERFLPGQNPGGEGTAPRQNPFDFLRRNRSGNSGGGG
ncbi:MAG: hypothetical protein R3B68_04770 [Phycisphaerales bacterium]